MENNISTSSKFFKWAGIVALISAGIYILISLVFAVPLILGGVAFPNIQIPNLIIHDYSGWAYIIANIFLLILIVLNIIIGIKLTGKYSKLSDEQLQNKLFPLIVIIVITMVTTLFSVSAILIGIGLIFSLINVGKTDSETSKQNSLKQKEEKQKLVEAKLAKSKNLLDSGLITKEEYSVITQKILSTGDVSELTSKAKLDPVEEKLLSIKKMKDSNLITEEEYKQMVKNLL